MLTDTIDFNNLFFTTATIQCWYPLFEKDIYKKIVTDSFQFLVENQRVKIFSFVIMHTHIHVIWEIKNKKKIGQIRQPFLKFTAQKFKQHLMLTNELELDVFKVEKIDRMYQFWKTNPKDIRIRNKYILFQKMDYIHQNLLKKELNDIEYSYSSANSYHLRVPQYKFLSLINDYPFRYPRDTE